VPNSGRLAVFDLPPPPRSPAADADDKKFNRRLVAPTMLQGLFVAGVKLPLALAELGLIDEYEFVVHPRLAGHGPTLFAGLSKRIDLKLLSRLEFASGAVAMRYEPIW
jgi:dihydrofolate reductase